MRICIEEFEKYYNRPAKRESNGTYKTMPQEKRKNADPQLNCTVYEIRLPRFPNEKDTKKCFTRLANFLSRNIHYGTVATLGYSTHAKWTPHRFEQGAKGGRAKKVFNDGNAYKRPPHIHLNLAGNEAHKIASKLYKNESRLYKRKYGKPFPKMQRDVVRSKTGHNLSREPTLNGKVHFIANLEILMILYKNIAWEKGEFSVMVKMNIDRLEIHFCILSTTTNTKES